jgi:hypothetical protein
LLLLPLLLVCVFQSIPNPTATEWDERTRRTNAERMQGVE